MLAANSAGELFGSDLAAALALVASLPLTETEKADAARRLLANGAGASR